MLAHIILCIYDYVIDEINGKYHWKEFYPISLASGSIWRLINLIYFEAECPDELGTIVVWDTMAGWGTQVEQGTGAGWGTTEETEPACTAHTPGVTQWTDTGWDVTGPIPG